MTEDSKPSSNGQKSSPPSEEASSTPSPAAGSPAAGGSGAAGSSGGAPSEGSGLGSSGLGSSGLGSSGAPSSGGAASAAGKDVGEGAAPGSDPGESRPDPLAQAQAEAARFKDQLLRTAADFDNFRKRSRRELEDAERRGRDDLLKELLPVFDNFERATAHATTAEATGGTKALVEGIELVMRQFADTLRKIGVERVPTVGHPFDPSVHEAIQHMESSEFSPGTIAAEVQAGYKAAERLVRPALVVVAKAPVPPPENEGNQAN